VRACGRPFDRDGVSDTGARRHPDSVCGHIRNFPRLTAAPSRYRTPADVYLERAQRYPHVPVKQAIISPSALSLLHPQSGIYGYPRQGLPR
jgi:hypothetical protein